MSTGAAPLFFLMMMAAATTMTTRPITTAMMIPDELEDPLDCDVLPFALFVSVEE
jgi:hypothetical protein